MIVQNINLSRRHNARLWLRGGTFGCTDTHAQMNTVERQLQTMLYVVRFMIPVPEAEDTEEVRSDGRGMARVRHRKR